MWERSETPSGGLLKVLFAWKRPHLFPCEWAYYVEIHRDEITPRFLRYVDEAETKRLTDRYFDGVDEWARNNPALAREHCAYFLIANDLSACRLQQPYFPYSGMWNACNPLITFKKTLVTVEEIRALKGANPS